MSGTASALPGTAAAVGDLLIRAFAEARQRLGACCSQAMSAGQAGRALCEWAMLCTAHHLLELANNRAAGI
jgi:hypothetical protein